MKKDIDLVMKKNVGFDDNNSAQFIYSDLYQPLAWPDEYPCFIQIHSEWPVQDVPLHWHHGPELIYSRNQEIRFIVDTEKTVIHPGECILISSGAIHNVEPKKEIRNQDVMSLTFKGTYIEKIYPKLRQTKISFVSPDSTDEDRQELVEYCEKLYAILEQDTKDYFALNEVLFHILGLIFNRFVSKECNETQSTKHNHDKMSLVLQYVEEHYQEEIRLGLLADMVGMTEVSFSRFFKLRTGKNLSDYIIDLRLGHATRLLVDSTMAIAEICYECGFNNLSNFNRIFKKKKNCSPKEFRDDYRKKRTII